MECLAQKAICLLDCIIAFCSAGLSHIFFILTDYSSKPLRTTPRTSRSCGPWRKTPALRHSWLSLMPNLLHWVQVPWHGLQLERHPGINACVSTPVLSTIHNWDQKGYIYIYIYGLYIYHSKKKNLRAWSLFLFVKVTMDGFCFTQFCCTTRYTSLWVDPST